MSVAKDIALIKALGGGSGSSGGSSGAYEGYVTELDYDAGQLTHTWSAINQAMKNGYPVFITTDDYVAKVLVTGVYDEMYYVLYYDNDGRAMLTTNSSEGYPAVGR